MERRVKKRTMAFLSVYLFCLFFAPPIIPNLNFFYVVIVFSFFMLFKYREEKKQIIATTKMWTFAKTFILIAVLTMVVGCVNYLLHNIQSVPDVFSTPARLLLSCPMGLLCIVYFLCVCHKNKLTKHDVLMAIIYAGLIESVLAILALLFPEIKDLFLQVMRSNINNVAIARESLAEFRLFGFAKDLFDHFGYGMGIVASLPIFIAIRDHNIKYIALSIPMIIAIILNARTGIVVIGIMISMILLGYMNGLLRDPTKSSYVKMKLMMRFAGMLVVCIAIFPPIVNAVYGMNPKMKAFTIGDFSSVINGLRLGGDSVDSGTGKILFSDAFWQFPDSVVGWVIGEGHSLYGVDGYLHSDVGYINDLWSFGILGCLIVYGMLAYYALIITRPKSNLERMFMAGVVLSFFIYQIKGTALWSGNLGILITMMLVFMLSYYNRRRI